MAQMRFAAVLPSAGGVVIGGFEAGGNVCEMLLAPVVHANSDAPQAGVGVGVDAQDGAGSPYMFLTR